MSGGVSVWIATDEDGDQCISKDAPAWDSSDGIYLQREPYHFFRQTMGISVPPGKCREFRLVPVGDAVTEPQPVAVPQCVKDWAKRTRCGQREWNWILQDDTEATVAWIESLDSPTVDAVAPSDDATQSQPQPVPVSPLALWIADKSFALAIECLRMGKPLTADDMAKLVEQTVVASIAAAARIEGGDDATKRIETRSYRRPVPPLA